MTLGAKPDLVNRRFSALLVGSLAVLLTMLIAVGHRGVTESGTELHRRSETYLAKSDVGPYDPRPDHIWNRLYRHFYVRVATDGRQFGVDELDPLLWDETKYLISGPSHQQALNLLDEFLAKRADKLITDPLKHAMLQRDLWAIFDWLSLKNDHPSEREALQRKLALMIQRLALTADQIKLLPDNYAAAAATGSFPKQYQPEKHEAAFLPPELLREQGPWIVIGDMKGQLPAPVHTGSAPFNGRSTFLILMRLPAGREATIAYLQRLREFPKPWISNPDRSRESEPFVPNPDLPQFPEGTQTALVRRMMLIDSNGDLVPTNLTESVQIRVYRSIPAGTAIRQPEALRTQDVFQFTLSRRKLFDGPAGSLSEVLRDEKEFMLFRSHGIDWFEHEGDPESDRFSVLNQCANCHASPGIHSVLSYSERRFQPSIFPPAFSETKIADQEQMALGWKRRQYESELLRGLWQTTSR
jgi:hypothetical protein